MSFIRQLFGGVLTALLASGLILGGFILAFAEEGLPTARLATALPPLQTNPVDTARPTLPASATHTPTTALETPSPVPPSLTPSPTETASATAALTPTPTSCPPPEGWYTVVVQSGDTLASLAQKYGGTAAALAEANCVQNETLTPGSLFYVPGLPTTAPTVVTCGPLASWTTYTVRAGDTLFRISQLFRTTVAQLRSANCLGSTDTIRVGQRLYVPNVPVSTSPPQPTGVPTVQPIPTDAASPVPTTLPPPDTDTPVPTLETPPTAAPPTDTPPASPTATTPPPLPTEAPTVVAPTEPIPPSPQPTEAQPTASPAGTSSP